MSWIDEENQRSAGGLSKGVVPQALSGVAPESRQETVILKTLVTLRLNPVSAEPF